MSKEQIEMFERNECMVERMAGTIFMNFLTENQVDIEEFLETGRVALFDGVMKYDDHVEATEKTYLYAVIKYRLFDYVRKYEVREQYPIEFCGDKVDLLFNKSTSLEQTYVNREKEEMIYKIARESGIKKLEPQLRLIAKGYRVNEIEQILGVSQQTQYNRLKKFKKILSKKLKKEECLW